MSKVTRNHYRICPKCGTQNWNAECTECGEQFTDIHKCRSCGNKYVDEFFSDISTAYCRWCTGEEI